MMFWAIFVFPIKELRYDASSSDLVLHSSLQLTAYLMGLTSVSFRILWTQPYQSSQPFIKKHDIVSALLDFHSQILKLDESYQWEANWQLSFWR